MNEFLLCDTVKYIPCGYSSGDRTCLTGIFFLKLCQQCLNLKLPTNHYTQLKKTKQSKRDRDDRNERHLFFTNLFMTLFACNIFT